MSETNADRLEYGNGEVVENVTEECRRQILEMARQGMSDKQIAQVVHYAPMYIREIRLKAGILRPKIGNKRYSTERIYKLLADGVSPQIIAETVGCSVDLVLYYRRKAKE